MEDKIVEESTKRTTEMTVMVEIGTCPERGSSRLGSTQITFPCQD